ncbi:uncharacterized protein LOC131957855 [Physella acuta]|uniref:uncharacterized protein LOC131957855 n=1 Tax=Physella acuta TaxID=109671 RepID=UPI0027DEA6EA|nr:uncharacterized protein LOC131957855 [Physella acuta]
MATKVTETEPKQEINFVLLGKTGVGKSSTGNTILGNKKFKSSADKTSCTKLSQLECEELDEITVNVVDTPGICDTETAEKTTLENIYHSMSLCPDGFDALLFVITFDGKCTIEDIKTIKCLQESFGKAFFEYCIVVVTHGTSYDLNGGGVSFDEWVKLQTTPKEFHDLLEACSYRTVLFYNTVYPGMENKINKSVSDLFQVTRSLSGRYRSEDFDRAVLSREKLIIEAKLPVLERKIQQKLSLLNSEVYRAISNLDNETVNSIENLSNEGNHLLDEINCQDKGTQEFKDLKNKIVSIMNKIKRLSSTKEEMNAELLQIQKDIEIVKNPPSSLPVCVTTFGGLFGISAFALLAEPIAAPLIAVPIGVWFISSIVVAKFTSEKEEKYRAAKKRLKQ